MQHAARVTDKKRREGKGGSAFVGSLLRNSTLRASARPLISSAWKHPFLLRFLLSRARVVVRLFANVSPPLLRLAGPVVLVVPVFHSSALFFVLVCARSGVFEVKKKG